MLQYQDFNKASSSNKWVNKAQINGVEAPRNSLDFPLESRYYNFFQEDDPCMCNSRSCHSKMRFPGASEPIKKTTSDDIYDRFKKPSVIARLMGMETFPEEMEFTRNADGGYARSKQRKDQIQMFQPNIYRAATPQDDIACYDGSLDFYRLNKETDTMKLLPQQREHPQEEVLQKFKRDFRAWQASKDQQTERREHTSCERSMWLYDSERSSSQVSYGKPKNYAVQQDKHHSFHHQSEEQCFRHSFHHENERCPSPTRIVILKPCPEVCEGIEESLVNSPELVKKEYDIEAFLQEVRRRLEIELQGRTAAAGSQKPATGQVYDETPVYHERYGDQEYNAKSTANRMKDTVSKQVNKMLTRSESIPSNGRNQGEHISREAKKLLSDRLKNVLRREIDADMASTSHGRRANSASFEEDFRLRSHSPVYDPTKKVRLIKSKDEDKMQLAESDVKSFRHDEQVSPRSLMRSLSAPVGTAFANLLSEHPCLTTRAHIKRKQEVSSSQKLNPVEERKSRRDNFSIKGKVSNLKQNFTLRTKFFGKKLQPTDQLDPDELNPIGRFTSCPSVLIYPGIVKDNSTEVPPSPVSVCSSPPDGTGRGGYPSPVSPLEASFTDDRTLLKVSREIGSSVPHPLDPGTEVGQGQISATDQALATNAAQDDSSENESHIRQYVRNILYVAGLHEFPPLNEIVSGWEFKPIPICIFDEVEQTVLAQSKNAEGSTHTCDCDNRMNHRLLFDLINEALSVIMPPPANEYNTLRRPMRMRRHKDQTLDDACRWIQAAIQVSNQVLHANSVDELVARDLGVCSWKHVTAEDVSVITTDVEWELLEEEVDELVWDVLVNVSE